MKIRSILLLALISFQVHGVELTISWVYCSKHVTYEVNTKVEKEGNKQQITHKFPKRFSFSRLATGRQSTKGDSNFIGWSGSLTTITNHGVTLPGMLGMSTYEQGSTNLQTINLLGYMAEVLNGHNDQIEANTLVSLPYLPAGVFPGNAEHHNQIINVRMDKPTENLVHMTVTVHYPSGDNDYNIYLQYNDGVYHLMVAHQAFDPTQVTQITALHITAGESSTTISASSYTEIGLEDVSYQYAQIPAAVFQQLAMPTDASNSALLGDTQVSPDSCCGVNVAAFLLTLKVIASYLTCGVCRRPDS